MIRSLPVAVALSLLLTVPGLTADKKKSAVPPKSSKIAIPPVDPSTTNEPGKLISSEMSGRDLEFFTAAVNAGRLQAFLVGLLKSRAESSQIKQLADALDSTQEKENIQISRLAALKGWNVSTEPTSEQKKTGADLQALTGSNFDKAAMDKIVAVNQQAVDAYKAAAQSGDADIRAFSDQMLPIAEDKLRLTAKMTGAGNKAASQLFRKNIVPKDEASVPAATPEPKPVSTPAAKATPTPAPTPKATPATPVPAATPTATPVPVATPVASPTPKATPVATPPPATPKATPVQTPVPAATPASTPIASPKPKATPKHGKKGKATPSPTPLAATPTPIPATPAPFASGTPVATPKLLSPASLKSALGATVPPIATPPGTTSAPAADLPPILPHQVRATPVPAATPQ